MNSLSRVAIYYHLTFHPWKEIKNENNIGGCQLMENFGQTHNRTIYSLIISWLSEIYCDVLWNLLLILLIRGSNRIWNCYNFICDGWILLPISIADLTYETRYGSAAKKCRSPSGVTRKSTFNFPNLILFFVTFSFHPIKLWLLLNISLTVTYIPAAIYTKMWV